MNKKLVSIVVPVYNVEEYLRECIDSICTQTYENIEIILVDDGSTDTSPEICDTYQKIDSRIRAFHKNNGGLSDARNYGLNVATGEYIAFVDSDDYIDESFVKKLLQAAEEKGLTFREVLYLPEMIDARIKKEIEKREEPFRRTPQQ